jgi:hypothetical protein
MMNDVSFIVVLAATKFTVPAAVYLWSKDSARRNRARDLLKLLFGR